MGSTLGPNSGPRAGVILAHPNSFPFPPYYSPGRKVLLGYESSYCFPSNIAPGIREVWPVLVEKTDISLHCTVIFFGRISFKNGRTRAGEFSPILVEYRPSWPKFSPWWVFCAPIWAKFGQFAKVSATFGFNYCFCVDQAFYLNRAPTKRTI
jgi:hypothetical protein